MCRMLPCRKTAVTKRQGCRRLIGKGSEAPRRISTLPSIPPKLKIPKNPPPPVPMPPSSKKSPESSRQKSRSRSPGSRTSQARWSASVGPANGWPPRARTSRSRRTGGSASPPCRLGCRTPGKVSAAAARGRRRIHSLFLPFLSAETMGPHADKHDRSVASLRECECVPIIPNLSANK